MIQRGAVVLPSVVLVVALLTSCGGGHDDSGAGSSSTPATSSALSSSSGSAGTTAPHDDSTAAAPPFPANIEPDTAEPSAHSFVTVTDVRTGHHDGYDRVVFEVKGTGTPGWDVRYVDTALGQGSGAEIPVRGNAVLQVTIRGVGYPTETGIAEYDGSRPLPGHDTEVVTEVVWNGTFEGTSVAFVGTTRQTPFRAYLLENPARIVLDVVHAVQR